MPVKKYLKESIKLGERELTVETGRVAKQADGSVVIRYGDTMLLVISRVTTELQSIPLHSSYSPTQTRDAAASRSRTLTSSPTP